MKFNKVETKSLAPHFRKMTRKRTATVVVTDSVTITDTEWSGGSRYVYSAIDPLSGCGLEPHSEDKPSGGFPSFEAGRKVLEPGRAVVKTGTFCGKPAGLYIYCCKQDVDIVTSAL